MGRKCGTKKRKSLVSKTDSSSIYTKARHLGQDYCSFCPPFKSDNSGLRGRKSRPDKHKNKRRETIRHD